MIELPEDFRDLLVELADAGAEFVVLGGHAVAFHGHLAPRKTSTYWYALLVTTRRESIGRSRHLVHRWLNSM